MSQRPDTPGWLGFLTGALVGYASIRGETRKGAGSPVNDGP